MKVLLINPPVPEQENWVREGRCQQLDIWGTPFPPLSLASIAGQIKSFSDTLLVDSGPAKLNLGKTIRIIKENNPELLIISTATPTVESDLGWFLPRIKELSPKIKSAAIGIHVTELPEQTLKEFSCLDFVIRGEPELTAKELAIFLKNKNENFKKILGLSFRRDDEIFSNPQREFISDLDNLEFPRWRGVDFNNYKLPILNRPFNLITFARGCPFSCKFCNASAYYGKIIRKRNPQRIIEEIKFNIENYGVKDFLFWTEFVTGDKDYLSCVIRLIKENNLQNKITWVGNSRASGIDFSLFKEMKESGCWQIAFGLEFGSDAILKLARKGPDASIKEHRQAVLAASRAGIVVDGHFILGYPGETKETLEKTIDFACGLPLTFAHFYKATLFPGSQLYKEAVENKWIEKPLWSTISQDGFGIGTNELDVKTIGRYVKLAYRKFYLRPKNIFRIIKIAKNPIEFANILKSGVKFIFNILS